MLAFSALVAGSFALGSLAANEITPIALTALRFGLATLIVGAAALATTGIKSWAWRMPWRYLILGGLMALYFVLMFEGLKTAPPVSAASVFTLTPVMAGLFGWLLMGQITTLRMAAALAIGAVGALWVISRADLSSLLQFQIGRGEVIYFVGCAGHALYSALIPRLNRGEPPVVFTFGTLLFGTILLVIWGWSEIWATPWSQLPAIVWITLGYVTLFATAATFVLVQFAALRLPAAKVMAYTYLTPSWVVLWQLALGKAVPPMLVLLGVVLTIVALLMLLRDESAIRADPVRVPETAQTPPD